MSGFWKKTIYDIIYLGFLFCKGCAGSGSFLGQSMFAADDQALIDFLAMREHPDGDFPHVTSDSIK